MKDPILYHTFDRLYNAVASVLPKSIQERPEILASGLGAVGGYLLTRGIQWGIKKVDKDFYDNYLPKIEKGLAAVVCVAPMVYAVVIDPEGAKSFMAQYPVYSAGVSAGLVGSATAAFQDASMHRKTLSNKLFDDIGGIARYDKKK